MGTTSGKESETACAGKLSRTACLTACTGSLGLAGRSYLVKLDLKQEHGVFIAGLVYIL